METSTPLPKLATIRRLRFAAAIGFAMALPICVSPVRAAETSCKIVEAASLPATFKNGELLVDVGVNGETVKFRIGTHSAFTQINRRLAERLHLPIQQGRFHVPTPEGTLTVDGVIVSGFTVGGRTGATTVFQAMDEGGDGATGEYAGIIGENYLQNFDVEIDPGAGLVNLLAPIECPGASAYWAAEHFELPIFLDRNRRPRAHVAIDGKPFYAYLDTGLAHSTIDFATAQRQLALPDSVVAPKPVFANVDREAPNPVFAFQELVFGPVTIRHPQFELQRYRALAAAKGSHVKETAGEDIPVTLGMDVLGKFHTLISNRNGMLYFTLPNERLPAAPPKP